MLNRAGLWMYDNGGWVYVVIMILLAIFGHDILTYLGDDGTHCPSMSYRGSDFPASCE